MHYGCAEMHKMKWNDLQYLLAVANNGSLAAAARALGVNHTTVLRRIRAFEDSHGLQLFERLRTGYVLTDEGHELLSAARSLENTLASLEMKLAGKEEKLEGVVRVTMTDTLFTAAAAPHIASFQKMHPDISIELSLTVNRLNLTKRDADVAIRAAISKPEQLVGEIVSDLGFGAYCTSHYCEQNQRRPLQAQTWLAPDEMMSAAPSAQWMQRNLKNPKIAFTADSFPALKEMAKSDLGIAILPCCMVCPSSGLMRIDLPDDNLKISLWVLTHEELLNSMRIKAFYQHMVQALRANREVLEGKVPPAD